MALPPLIKPMLASSGVMPTDDERWSFEFKWDGVRAVVYIDRRSVKAMTRNDRDVIAGYPELLDLAESVAPHRVVLDGELVAMDAAGRPSFGQLQQRMHVTKPGQVALLRQQVPVSYLVFDLLHLDGKSLLTKPWTDRRAALEGLGLTGPSWAVPPVFPGPGADVFAAAKTRGLEGVVAKRKDSLYEPGKRTGSWVKVKLERMQEVLVVGWKPGEGRREGTIGSLLLGVHDDSGGLVYAGHVGTGFSDRALDELKAQLAPLARPDSPTADEVPRMHARHANWVQPTVVGEVVFTEWTRDGRMRHPVWRGLRPDKQPEEVVREP
ncbi:MAG: bifunctional non-ous end joining protein LigD [Frankiaceae bacterium]|jgi:bifunctional non-homologous end joining protein LigD|nr:bifunctional non-ous end joining protein LigD [Frankiaceae bacterium]